ncbi:outer membrane lipoprotein carrier protein LolA [Porticoccaceae bacterium]|nr:outer membrane lipoprotein carrier protein LolA [Porticoccaceae bacterium]
MSRWIAVLLLAVTLPLSAADLVDQLSVRAGSLQSMQGRFSMQRQIAVLPLPLESKGRFKYSKGLGLRWETLSPVQSLLSINQQGVSVDGVQRSQIGVREFAKALLDIFAGDMEELADTFTISSIGDLNQWQLILEPRIHEVAARLVKISITGAKNTESIEILETNMDITLINLVTESVNTQPANSEGNYN